MTGTNCMANAGPAEVLLSLQQLCRVLHLLEESLFCKLHVCLWGMTRKSGGVYLSSLSLIRHASRIIDQLFAFRTTNAIR